MEVGKRIVVVGMGSIGRRHARLLNARRDVQVEICETMSNRADQALLELGERPIYTNYDDAIFTKPDIVIIATPHRLHAEQTIKALNEGIHVLCEKPMSDNLSDARRIVEVARKKEAILSFGFQLHFHPGILRLKQLIDKGDLGSILHIHMRVGSYITLVNSASRYQSKLEGSLLLDYAHQADLLYWLLGTKPKGIYAAGDQGGSMELSSNPNFLSITCDYDDPLLATIHLNYLQMPERHEYEIVGDAGWAVWDLNTGLLRIGKRVDSSEMKEKTPTERDPVYINEHQAFLDAVEGKRKPENQAHKAIVSQEIIEAALLSWKQNERCTL